MLCFAVAANMDADTIPLVGSNEEELQLEPLDPLGGGALRLAGTGLVRWLVTGNHDRSFDQCMSDLLSESVLARMDSADVSDVLAEYETDISALRQGTTGDPEQWALRCARFLDCGEGASREDITSAVALRQLALVRLVQLLHLVAPDDPRRAERANRATFAFECCHTVGRVLASQSACFESSGAEGADDEQRPRCDADDVPCFSWLDLRESDAHHVMVLYMLRMLQRSNLRKYEGMVYKERVSNGHRTHAWEEMESIEQFVYARANKDTNAAQWENLTATTATVRCVVGYLTTCQDAEFPELHFDREYMSFRNGMYHLLSNTFHEYGSSEFGVSRDVVSVNYFDEDFDAAMTSYADWRDIPTPHFETLFRYQQMSDATLECAFWMTGRLLYPIGAHDSWQFGIFLKGIAGSGKSTYADVVKSLYPARLVGTLSSNVEAKFGLSAIYDKLLFVCAEVKSNFGLDQGDWQSMVSGEDVSVAIKGKTALNVRWSVPGVLCGNELPSWVDASGSVVRRLVLFDFRLKPANPIADFGRQLKRQMAPLICKCNRAYLDAVERYRGLDVWAPGVVSDELHGVHREFKMQVDPMAAFLESSEMRLESEAYMPLEEFKKLFGLFKEESCGQPRGGWTKAVYLLAFQEKGLRIEKASLQYPKLGGRQLNNKTFVMGIDVAVG